MCDGSPFQVAVDGLAALNSLLLLPFQELITRHIVSHWTVVVAIDPLVLCCQVFTELNMSFSTEHRG